MTIKTYLDEMMENGADAKSPTNIDSIRIRENELKCSLSPSYVEFLLLSNGLVNFDHIYGSLLPIEEIGLYKVLSPDSYLVWTKDPFDVSDSDYFVYDEKQDTVKYRPEYLRSCIQISEEFDGAVILLNPCVVRENEMELIIMASWFPGAGRYKSFYDFFRETSRLG